MGLGETTIVCEGRRKERRPPRIMEGSKAGVIARDVDRTRVVIALDEDL